MVAIHSKIVLTLNQVSFVFKSTEDITFKYRKTNIPVLTKICKQLFLVLASNMLLLITITLVVIVKVLAIVWLFTRLKKKRCNEKPSTVQIRTYRNLNRNYSLANNHDYFTAHRLNRCTCIRYDRQSLIQRKLYRESDWSDTYWPQRMRFGKRASLLDCHSPDSFKFYDYQTCGLRRNPRIELNQRKYPSHLLLRDSFC